MSVGPNQSPVQWIPEIFPGGKVTDAWRCHPLPCGAEVKEIGRAILLLPLCAAFSGTLQGDIYLYFKESGWKVKLT